MKSIFEAISDFFATDGLAVHRIGNGHAYGMPFTGRNGKWGCVAYANETERSLVFYSTCPIQATAAALPAVAELLHRLNYSLLHGNFELGYLDGEIRFRTSIEVAEHALEHLMIDRVVYNNVATMDMYLPAIRAVIERGVDPLDALSDVLLVS